MHIVFIKKYDIYKAGSDYILERTLGARMCKLGVAVPYSVYIDMEAKARIEKAEAVKKAKALKVKKSEERKTADSKKTRKREKAKT